MSRRRRLSIRTTIFNLLGHDHRLDRQQLNALSSASVQAAINRSEVGRLCARVANLGHTVLDEAFLGFCSLGLDQCRHECLCSHGELTAERNLVAIIESTAGCHETLVSS